MSNEAKRSELSAPIGAVFEAVDATDDEMFYTIGVYQSLEAAVADLTRGEGTPTFQPRIGDGCWEHEDVATLKIYERRFGGFGRGKEVWWRCWTQDYSEDRDEYPWVYRNGSNSSDTGGEP